MLDSQHISAGDAILFESDAHKVEGELMPKTEVGSPDTLVIKLENGYNVGVRCTDRSKIKLIKKGTGTPTFPTSETKQKAGLPNVTLIYIGGTIGSKIDYKTGGVHMLIKPGELLFEVPELADLANLEIRNPFSIDSADISYHEWQIVAKEIESAFARGARGVVITMGTDAMHYTSSALSFMLKNLNGPVVITGAQRSSDRGSSDAFFNLSCAVKVAAESDIGEVVVCMHSSSSDDACMLTRGTRARKMHTSRRDAFRPINDRPIAFIDEKLKIKYNAAYSKAVKRSDAKTSAETDFEPKVALIQSHPNFDPEVINFYVDRGYRGIIIQGTGLGNVPCSTAHNEMLWTSPITHAIKKGVVIGMTSQCLYGRVNSNVYRLLRLISGLGVVYCEDMTPETALVKLSWLLANHSTEEARRMLNRPIAMEIKERSEPDEFLV
jgi:glutamyl-tRNA(Gln) amidotransferase subunit D